MQEWRDWQGVSSKTNVRVSAPNQFYFYWILLSSLNSKWCNVGFLPFGSFVEKTHTRLGFGILAFPCTCSVDLAKPLTKIFTGPKIPCMICPLSFSPGLPGPKRLLVFYLQWPFLSLRKPPSFRLGMCVHFVPPITSPLWLNFCLYSRTQFKHHFFSWLFQAISHPPPVICSHSILFFSCLEFTIIYPTLNEVVKYTICNSTTRDVGFTCLFLTSFFPMVELKVWMNVSTFSTLLWCLWL